MAKEEPKKLVALIVSYVPLLMAEPGRTDFDPKEIGPMVDQADGTAKACVWLQDDEHGPTACLLYENAQDIAEHLKLWSENEPEKWFQLVLAEHERLYGLALVPNLTKGVERFKMAYQLRHGYPLPPADFEMIFKPLNFTSLPGHVFTRIKPDLRPKTRVCLMRTTDFKGADTDWDGSVIELGQFELVTDGPLIGYVLENLKNAAADGSS